MTTKMSKTVDDNLTTKMSKNLQVTMSKKHSTEIVSKI